MTRTPYQKPSWEYPYQYHPGFYAYLNYKLAQFLKGHSVDPVAAGHVLNVLTSCLGLILLFLLTKSLFEARVGLWAVLLLAMFPRFIAHSHYNGKDVPVMVFSLGTICLLRRAIQSERIWLWLAAGCAFGISVATKLDALVMVPIVLLACLIAWLTKQSVSGQFREWGFFGVAAMVTIFLSWPALWREPLFLFKALRFFRGDFVEISVWYLSQQYPARYLPWHYTAFHLLAVTPIVTLVCLVIGIIGLTQSFQKRKKVFELSLLASWILLPLLPRFLDLLLQYDGMRHVFLILPPLMIVAAVGFDSVVSWLKRGGKKGVRGMIFVIGVLAWIGVQCVQVHPYQGSYLNEPVRLLVPTGQLNRYFDFPSWGSPLQEGIRWLNQYAPTNSTFNVPVENIEPVVQSYLLRKDLTTSSNAADFIIVWHEGVGKKPGVPVFSVKRYGTTLLTIYSADRKINRP